MTRGRRKKWVGQSPCVDDLVPLTTFFKTSRSRRTRADRHPPGVHFNMLEERIVGSDHTSAFLVGRDPIGYQLLGLGYYSTTRTKVPFLEVVKRTVQMIQELAATLELDISTRELTVHYPNIFPETWKMVTRYLRNPRVEHVLHGMAERAHCGSSDSVISLANCHRNREGRIHIAVNYGVGLHLAVCVLKEKANDRSIGGAQVD